MIGVAEFQKQLDGALMAYFVALESGEPFDQEEFLSRFPEIRKPLERILVDLGSSFKSPLHRPPETSEHGTRISGHWVAAGATIGGCRLIREVGSGIMGQVFEAEDLALGRKVAIKLYTGVGRLDPGTQNIFAQEAKIAASLPHEHIVQVYATGVDQSIPFISMELMKGGSLADLHAPLSPTLVAMIGFQSALALGYAHSRGVLHRDIKAANILLDENGIAHLGDFGLALVRGNTSQANPAGTLAYLCPEQVESSEIRFDQRGDIYSLGVTLYQGLTQKSPFGILGMTDLTKAILHGKIIPIPTVCPSCPLDLQKIILKAMSRLPGDRYQNALDFADDLGAFLQGFPVKARPLTTIQKATRWLSGHKKGVVLAMAMALSGIIAGVGLSGYRLWNAYEKELELRQEAQNERSISLQMITEIVRTARTFRHLPGQEDTERKLLEELIKGLENAVETFVPGHPLRVEYPLIVQQLSNLEARTGSPEKSEKLKNLAIRLLRQVARENPDRTDIIQTLSHLIDSDEKTLENFPEQALSGNTEALELVDQALKLKPDSGSLGDRKIWIQIKRILILTKLRRFDEGRRVGAEAVDQCLLLIARYPTGHPLSYIRPVLVWDTLANLEMEGGTTESVIQCYEQALHYDGLLQTHFPNDVFLREPVCLVGANYANFLVTMGLVEEANAILHKQAPPDSIFSMKYQKLSVAGKIQLAWEVVEKMIFDLQGSVPKF